MALTKRSFSLSSHLVLLVLAAMIPFFIFSTWAVDQILDYERSLRERQLSSMASELAERLEREVEASVRALQAISVSNSVRNGPNLDLYEKLKAIQKTQPSWVGILLHTNSMVPLINTSQDFKAKLMAPADPQSLEQVIETGEPVVGAGVVGRPKGSLEGRVGFAVRVPVKVNGKVTHVLSALIQSSSLQEILKQTGFETIQEWTRVIVDANGLVLARSRNPELFVGKMATPSYQKAMREKSQEFREEIALDGKEVYLAFKRGAFSQWTAAVVVPREVLDAPAERIEILVMGVGTLLVIIFGGIAFYYSRRLAFKIESAAKAAVELAEGREPFVQPSTVTEVEQLRNALISASNLLRAREKERTELLIEAQAARVEAERANQAKSYFLANMSHEIRTPLGVTLGIAELFANDEIPREEKAINLKVMKRNGQLLLTLINDILDLSRAEADKLTIEKASFHLTEFFAQIIEGFSNLTNEKNILIRLISDESLPQYIHTDSARFGQIVYNLIGNAVKFTAKGEIQIELKKAGRDLQVFVRDTGPGISEEHQKNLFNVFTQGEEAHNRKFGGAGLGLALSKKLTELLGGNLILVESRVGQGTTFLIQIPLE